jgi:V-type H+-transporting ATPase subunit E
MVSFITQEATEKAHEIRLKADEEFNSEKVKLINTEREAIDREFAANYKKFDLQRKVDHSKIGNQTRLQVLAYQKEQLDTLFEEAANRLKEVHKRGDYKELLRDLILEGAFSVTEKKMTVQALERDWNLVREVLPQIEETYRKGIEADGNLSLDEIKLDESNSLNENE